MKQGRPTMADAIAVTSETVDALLPELPRLVRMTLGFASKLRHGLLDVILPDGRTVRLGNNAPGPAATMKVFDYGFASRLLRSGDIGIAEAYLRGEWDTPDLTQFLYLFCVNQDWMQTMKIGKPVIERVRQSGSAYYSSDCPMAGHQIESGLESPRAPEHPLRLLRIAYGL